MSKQFENAIIGENTIIEEDVIVGMQYHPDCGKAVIGGGCLILPGVRIGERSFIAAGAVVTKDVPPRSLVMGFPAKCVPLPEDLDVPCRPEMAQQKADLWHPLGSSPFEAHWVEGYGEPPIPEKL